jgi:ATP-dependent DNA helicase RecG
MIHPEIEWDIDENYSPNSSKLTPIYSESEGLNQKLIHKIMEQALELGLPLIKDDLPLKVLEKNNLPKIQETLLQLHRPEKNFDKQKYLNRLIYDEFFKFEWIMGRKRLNLRKESTQGFNQNENTKILFENVVKKLPFTLTQDQIKALEKINFDLSQTKPMNRLLLGDVGCGKTIVALLTCLTVIAHRAQCALMVPTEILATQHFQNALKFLDGILIPQSETHFSPKLLQVELLVGSTTKSKREKILFDLKNGNIDLLIGTHALLEDDVIFSNLGYVIFDEQHRFGVDQRLRLKQKGLAPHILSMSATPIPRTLALTLYGDLDITTIKNPPKNKAQITTKLFKSTQKNEALLFAKKELEKGHQVYVIYPLIEESEKLDLKNAIDGAKELQETFFKDFKVGLLHGKLSAQEKAQIMNDFKNKKIQILVSTTVVEVGVDVPNATIMIIENAERFGLSQLHQLRGRVGRGQFPSYCFLIYDYANPVAFERLKAMESTQDGFKLAELDLEIRGPGEFLGTKQSGALPFKFASLVRDQKILEQARQDAFELLKEDPELKKEENLNLRLYMQKQGYLQIERLNI